MSARLEVLHRQFREATTDLIEMIKEQQNMGPDHKHWFLMQAEVDGQKAKIARLDDEIEECFEEKT